MVMQEKFDIENYLYKSKFQSEELIEFLFSNNVGMLIVLDFIKAKDWPYYGKKLCNDPIKNIPLIWALFYSEDGESVKQAVPKLLNQKKFNKFCLSINIL